MFESVITPKRPNWILRILAAVLLVVAAVSASLWQMSQMPLSSYRGPLPALTVSQSELASRLEKHVQYLSHEIGERNLDRVASMKTTTDYIRGELAQLGYSVDEQNYIVAGQSASNLEAQLPGASASEAIVIVGAHYDSVTGTVGADDNASGVAAVFELARILKETRLRRTVRFVFFANEEPPYFQTDTMGSFVYAHELHSKGIRVSAMISLETIGFYSDFPGSQKYPPVLGLLYPSRGNFVGFVSDGESRDLLQRSIRAFRGSAKFPSEGVAAPATWPGVGWSDHWSFWQFGYPAIMVTDTAPFRNPYYHTVRDTRDKLDFPKLALVVDGLRSVISALADE
jgi:Zn-dependent M28 family amino/carboxypeptidase